tara:strand:+ start:73 stop:303 length:231 start_codon:yes stop_codon:yes gene_type:complete
MIEQTSTRTYTKEEVERIIYIAYEMGVITTLAFGAEALAVIPTKVRELLDNAEHLKQTEAILGINTRKHKTTSKLN